MSVEDAENLDIKEVHKLYKKYIFKKSQVELIGSFWLGNDLVDYAEGSYIYLKKWKKNNRFYRRDSVLGHGHNHPRIIKERKKFQENKRMEVHKNFFSPYMLLLVIILLS